MLAGEAAQSGPVGRKVLASRAGQFFASAEEMKTGKGFVEDACESERGIANAVEG